MIYINAFCIIIHCSRMVTSLTTSILASESRSYSRRPPSLCINVSVIVRIVPSIHFAKVGTFYQRSDIKRFSCRSLMNHYFFKFCFCKDNPFLFVVVSIVNNRLYEVVLTCRSQGTSITSNNILVFFASHLFKSPGVVVSIIHIRLRFSRYRTLNSIYSVFSINQSECQWHCRHSFYGMCTPICACLKILLCGQVHKETSFARCSNFFCTIANYFLRNCCCRFWQCIVAICCRSTIRIGNSKVYSQRIMVGSCKRCVVQEIVSFDF